MLAFCNERERITVLLDENSINEYPLFYTRYIHNKLPYQNARAFPCLLGRPNLIINGEGNDQVFGSDIVAEAIHLFGAAAVLGRLQRELITSLYQVKLGGDRQTALFFSALFGRLAETAPVPIKTNFDLLWWVNFALKWQTVYMRSLIFSQKPLSPEWVGAFYQPFFNTREFQLWSMNNPDQKIKNHWPSYKWPAKDLICEFTRDPDYRDNKIKRGSLTFLLNDRPYHNFLDENFAFQQEMDWYRPDNDFIPASCAPANAAHGADGR
jgi:hypothetical protein